MSIDRCVYKLLPLVSDAMFKKARDGHQILSRTCALRCFMLVRLFVNVCIKYDQT